MSYRRKKSLLIGINYVGGSGELRGYADTPHDRVILTDKPEVDPSGPYYPTGANLLAAMDWLVSEPGCTLFLHYSGHGGLIEDVDGNRGEGGMDASIVPVDHERHGQISSTILHARLVTYMAADCTLFVIMDCCHSGSTLELPYLYRSDSEGQISLMDNLKMGMALATTRGISWPVAFRLARWVRPRS
jgi:hypothetical protein